MIIKINNFVTCFAEIFSSDLFSIDTRLMQAYVHLYGLRKPYRFMRAVEELYYCALDSDPN
ncbi:MAG: hypothetical protein ACI80L_001941 [Pseudohongiellaceae bacterium]|jgi:hypothetical protein